MSDEINAQKNPHVKEAKHTVTEAKITLDATPAKQVHTEIKRLSDRANEKKIEDEIQSKLDKKLDKMLEEMVKFQKKVQAESTAFLTATWNPSGILAEALIYFQNPDKKVQSTEHINNDVVMRASEILEEIYKSVWKDVKATHAPIGEKKFNEIFSETVKQKAAALAGLGKE